MWLPLKVLILSFYCVYAIDKCPQPEVVKNFNLVKDYCTGVWFQIARYNSIVVEEDATCIYYNIEPDGRNCKFILNKATNTKVETYRGCLQHNPRAGTAASIPDNIFYEEGILNVTLNFLLFKSDEYALVYDCAFDPVKKTNIVYAWVTSPTTCLSDEAKNTIANYVEESDFLDADKFILDHWDSTCLLKNTQSRVQLAHRRHNL